ncbi:MAG: hypothetical protein IIA75_11740 [Proteobacteria bacterium]|nr:hypothetical protein [Pseudomonadota bacterium]
MSVRIEDMAPLPTGVSLNEEALERYENAYRNHYQAWGEILNRNIESITKGSYSLHWLDTDKANWGRRAKPSARGLTYTDINNIRGYGQMPDRAEWLNFAPRGSVREPYREEMPTIGDYSVLNKGELWADNVLTLYEEAKARQWNVTRDIPWEDLKPLPDDPE